VQFAPDGTAGQPSFGFTNNAGTGMYNAAGVLGFATNAIQRISISTTGAVTVNAPTSGVAFSVVGAGTVPLQLTELTALPTSQLGAYVAIATAAVSGGSGINGDLLLAPRSSNANSILFATGNGATTVRMQINSTGNVTIAAPSSGTTLSISNAAGSVLLNATDGTQTFQTYTSAGNVWAGATSNSIFNILQNNAARLSFDTSGGIYTAGATGSGQGSGTLNATGLYVNGVNQNQSGTFTGTLTGCATAPTATFNYAIAGNTATIYLLAGFAATSNATTCTVTGLPAALTPANSVFVSATCIENNGTIGNQAAAVSGTTLVLSNTVAAGNAAGAFTATGTKGLSGGFSMTYPLK
jgi:hypothetical protein